MYVVNKGGLQECRSTFESTQLASLSRLDMKIIIKTRNPLSSQDELTQMLRGKINHSNLYSVD